MNVMVFHVTFVTYQRDRQPVEHSYLCQSSPLRWQVSWWFESRYDSGRRPAAWHRTRLWRWRPVSRAANAYRCTCVSIAQSAPGLPAARVGPPARRTRPAPLIVRPKPDPVGRELRSNTSSAHRGPCECGPQGPWSVKYQPNRRQSESCRLRFVSRLGDRT